MHSRRGIFGARARSVPVFLCARRMAKQLRRRLPRAAATAGRAKHVHNLFRTRFTRSVGRGTGLRPQQGARSAPLSLVNTNNILLQGEIHPGEPIASQDL